MAIPSISESNELMKNLINEKEPFFISRLGGSIGTLTRNYKANMQIPRRIITHSQTHDGIYCNNMNDLLKYADMYGLEKLAEDIKEFEKEDPIFWKLSPLIEKLIKENKNFDSLN